MKVALTFVLLLAMLCVKLGEAGCCCSTTGKYSITPLENINDAKYFVLDLINQNLTAKNFLRKLGKMDSKWLTPILLQLQKRLFQSNLSNVKYSFDTYGHDFTIYCSTPQRSSLTTQGSGKAAGSLFPFPTYSGIISGNPFPRAQDITTFEQWWGGIPKEGEDSDIEQFLIPVPFRSKPKFKDSIGMAWLKDGFYVNPAQAYDLNATLCLLGYELWFREAMGMMMDTAGNPNQLFYWLTSLAIPNLAPQDAQYFVRWLSDWVISQIGNQANIGDLVCEKNQVCDQNEKC